MNTNIQLNNEVFATIPPMYKRVAQHFTEGKNYDEIAGLLGIKRTKVVHHMGVARKNGIIPKVSRKMRSKSVPKAMTNLLASPEIPEILIDESIESLFQVITREATITCHKQVNVEIGPKMIKVSW